jgi:hypothetical protein
MAVPGESVDVGHHGVPPPLDAVEASHRHALGAKRGALGFGLDEREGPERGELQDVAVGRARDRRVHAGRAGRLVNVLAAQLGKLRFLQSPQLVVAVGPQVDATLTARLELVVIPLELGEQRGPQLVRYGGINGRQVRQGRREPGPECSVVDVFAVRLIDREAGKVARAVTPPPLDAEVADFPRKRAHGWIHDRRDRQYVGATRSRPPVVLVIAALHAAMLRCVRPELLKCHVPRMGRHWMSPPE